MFFKKLAPHLLRGQAGERRAAAYLKAQGLTIVANNIRSRYGEIDLIARDGAVLVFVEVRSVTEQNFLHFLAETSALARAPRGAFICASANVFFHGVILG